MSHHHITIMIRHFIIIIVATFKREVHSILKVMASNSISSLNHHLNSVYFNTTIIIKVEQLRRLIPSIIRIWMLTRRWPLILQISYILSLPCPVIVLQFGNPRRYFIWCRDHGWLLLITIRWLLTLKQTILSYPCTSKSISIPIIIT